MFEELYHHGVKGMKWGVRKQRKLARRIKKAYKKDQESNKGGPFYHPSATKIIKDNVYLTKEDKSRLDKAFDDFLKVSKKSDAAEEKLFKEAVKIGTAEFNAWAKKHPEDKNNEKLENSYIFNVGYEEAQKRNPQLAKTTGLANKPYENYRNEVKKIADNFIGKYGNDLAYKKNNEVRIGEIVVDSIAEKYRDERFKHSEELYHYGVKGMKWGIRHDRKRSGRIRRKKMSSKISKTKRGWSDIDSDTQILLIELGAMALASIGMVAASKISDIIEKRRFEKKYTKEQRDNFKKVNKISKKDEEAVKTMNPTGSMINCGFTSTGYVYQKLTGKEVTAKKWSNFNTDITTPSGGVKFDAIDKKIFSNAKVTDYSKNIKRIADLPDFYEASVNMKDDTFGIIGIQGVFGGHFMNYEKKNGVVTLIDPQSPSVKGKQICSVEEWAQMGYRVDRVIDCTNATISKESENKYIKNMLDRKV